MPTQALTVALVALTLSSQSSKSMTAAHAECLLSWWPVVLALHAGETFRACSFTQGTYGGVK